MNLLALVSNSFKMAYDEHLGERIAKVLKEKRVRYEAKNMIGGLCFMVNDKMAVGVAKASRKPSASKQRKPAAKKRRPK